jgi:hypothetical protein
MHRKPLTVGSSRLLGMDAWTTTPKPHTVALRPTTSRRPALSRRPRRLYGPGKNGNTGGEDLGAGGLWRCMFAPDKDGSTC